jgi:hypothetical protein
MGLSALDTIVPPSVPDYVSSPPTIQGPTGDPTVTVAGSPSGDRVMRILARALTSELSRRSAASRVRLQLVYATHLLPDPGAWIRVALRRTHSSWLRRSLRAAGKLTNDPVDRMDTYNRCERWVLQQGYVIPLASTTVAYLIKPSVQGMQVTPTGIMPDNNNWALAGVT